MLPITVSDRIRRIIQADSGVIFFCLVLLIILSKEVYAADIKLRFQRDSDEPVKNAVVTLTPIQQEAFTVQSRAEIDQHNFKFVPDVMVIRKNTLVYFPNSDDVRHHVYSFSSAKKFELRLYHGKTAEPVLFDQPGKVVLGCNIHDSMVATIYVVDTAYFAQSDQDGLAVIEKLPVGSYRLNVYHPYQKDDYPEQLLEIKNDKDDIKKMIRMDGLVVPDTNNPDNEYKNLFE
jgi:plastocyanin